MELIKQEVIATQMNEQRKPSPNLPINGER